MLFRVANILSLRVQRSESTDVASRYKVVPTFITDSRRNANSIISNIFIYLNLAWVTIALVGCAASQRLKPLAVGEQELVLAVGGPLVEQGATFPAPYSVLSYAYGVTERFTAHGSWHPSAALYKVMVLGAGGSIGLLQQDGWWPQLLIDVQGIVASDFSETAFWPLFTLLASHQLRQYPLSLYAGIDTLFQFHSNHNPVLPRSYAPLIGVRYTSKQKLHAGLELKWLGISDEIEESTLDFPKPFGSDYGAFGIYLMISRAWNKGD